MDQSAKYWENLLFGVFTTELHIDTFINEVSGKSWGCIVPTERIYETIIGASVGLLGVWPTEAIATEFEKEVSNNIQMLSDFSQRHSYLLRMKFRFQKSFDLIPIYNEVLPKLFQYVVINLDTEGFDLYSRIYFFNDLIMGVKLIIDESYDTEVKINSLVSHESTAQQVNQERRVNSLEKNELPSAPVVALFFSYLMNGRIEPFDRSKKNVESLIKKYSFPHSTNTVRNDLYNIDKYNNNATYVTRAIELLAKNPNYKPAMSKAENDLYLININSN